MINWDNFNRNNIDDEDEENKKTRVGTINWDTFNPNGLSTANQRKSIDWDNFNTSKNVFDGIEGFTTGEKEIKKQISNILSNNTKNDANNDLTITTYQNENEALNREKNREEIRDVRKSQISSINERASNFRQKAKNKTDNTKTDDKKNVNQTVPTVVNNTQEDERINRSKESLIKPVANHTTNENTEVVDENNNLDASDMYILQKQHSTWNEAYGEHVTDNSNVLDLRNNTQKKSDAIKGFTGNVLEGADSFIPNVVNYIHAGEKIIAKNNIENGLKMLGYNDDVIDKILPVAMYKYQKLSPIGQLNSLLNNETSKRQREENIRINNIRASNTNPLLEKLTELAPSLGDNFVSYGLTAINPVLGTASFMLSAGGSYLDDAKSRGMNDEQAFAYASVMGAFEGGTESIISGNFIDKVGRKLIGKGLSKEVLNSFGVSSAENFFQEAVMEPLQEKMAEIIGGPETANWEDIWKRFFESGVDGIISAIILGGASVGIASTENVLGNNHPSSDQYAQAIADTINSEKVDVNKIVEGAKQAIIDSKDNLKPFYATNFNQDGTIENIKTVIGKEIENPNNKINITPVIVKNENNSYNVIDKITGLSLDSSPYETMNGAQLGFTDKITKLDEASINNINRKVSQARLSIEQEKINIIQNESLTPQENVEETSKTGTNNVMENRYVDINTEDDVNINDNPYQSPLNKNMDNMVDNSQSYRPNNEENARSQNNGLNEVSKLVSQISDTSLYNRERTNAIFRNVARNIPNIELQVNENSTYLNSLDRNGNVVYQHQIANRPYVGAELREVVNNAITNTDLSNINTAQAGQNGFRGISNDETINYMSRIGNEVIEDNNSISNLSDEEVKSIVKYNPDGREISDSNYVDFLVERYKDNKNISGVVTDTRYVESIKNNNEKLMLDDLYNQITNKSFNSKKTLLDEHGKAKNVIINLEITKQGLKESLNKSMSDEKLAVIPYLDILIQTSNNGIIRPENKNRRNIFSWYYLYNTAEINGELYGVKIDLKKTQVGDRFYVHRVNLINNKGNISSVPGFEHATERNNTFPSVNTSITQQGKNVKNNTNVNNKSMQNNKNNAQEQQKEIQKELHNRIQNAILNRNSRKNTFLGTVSDKVANKIKSLFGIDVSGRKHIISDNDIRHMIKQHGNPEIEKTRGQIAVTTKDIEKIPDIIENYDSIEKGSINKDAFTKQKLNTIRYKKQYSDNTTYVVEVIPSDSNNLTIKTMWKKKNAINKKNNSSRVNHANNNIDPQNTPGAEPTSSYSSKSIPQSNENVKDNGIRAERTSNTTEYDNQGNKLTKAQREFFKNSKVRDENGKLLVMYHGTEANVGIPSEFWFTIFDIDKSGNHGNMLGDGFYFTSNIEHAQQYAHLKGNIYETYLNITKPLELKHFSTGELSYAIRKINPYIEADIYKRDGTIDGYKVRRYLLDNGYDGIHSGNTYVAFDSNQIKNITNNSPTSNPDIRYERTNTTSQPYDARKYEKNDDFVNYLKDNNYLNTLMEVDNQQGETYAHNFERRIEQEIRNVESTGAFDNSIPITKLSDIDKMVKDFLGTQIQKGHFRQRARGIYNTQTDTIRVKEYKDMDNVLHEMGHALDLGNRIKIDKETIATELLDAIKKHGGYENEARSIQLDEGFAEIVKEYAINPVQTKLDYPQTYAVLEAERQQNVKFNTFIGNLQTQLYNYIHQNPENRVLSNLSIGEQTDKAPVTIKSIEENVVRWVWDRDISIKSMANELAKASGKKLTPSQNVYLLTRLASGVNNKAISMISKGYIDLNGNRLMPGLNKLGEILGNDPQRWNDLRAFLVAKRDLEYKAKSLKSGIRTIDSKAVVEKFYNDTQIQEAAQVVYDTLDGVLQYAVDNGLITQENAKSLRESNAFYVPFQRVIEGRGNQIGRRGAVADIINKRTGSELDIKDVLENIVANSANIIQQVENNNILRTLAEQGESAGIKNNIFEEIAPPMKKIGSEQLSTWEAELKRQGVDTSELDLEKTIDLFVPNNNIVTEHNGSHIVSFFDKEGKRRYLEFYKESTDIFNALMGMDKNANSAFLKIMRKMNMPLRYGATMANVGFAIPNMISDTVQATIYSEAGFIPVVDNVLGILDILGATNNTVRKFLNQVAPGYAERINRLYDIYQQTGASSSTRMSQYRKSQQEIMKDIYGIDSKTLGIKESFVPLKRLMDLLTYIPELSESSTRFRVFERNYEAYKNKGGSELDARVKAAIESRDATQDFGRTGTFMREINQIIPFSAARVGSAYTFAEKMKANPKRTSARIAILLTVAMAIKALGYDDDEIEELNQRKKDDNFVIKVGDTVVTIKKPQGILRSIINLTEYVQDLATGHIEEGKEGERLGEWLNNAIMDNMPADEVGGLVPNAIAPLIENRYNKDLYYDTDIVKSWDLDLPDEQQYYDYTSQLAIWLGQIFNYSPAKIDNLINGYLGGLGTQVTNVIDWISGKMGLSAEEPAMGAEDNAVGKRFVVNVNENSASVDEIYSREEELTKKLNGGTITEEENAELENIKAGINKLSALNKQIKAIKQDLTMSGEEKADKIRPLQEQKVDVARQALGKEPIYTENTDNLDSLEFYPSRSTLSYNGLTLELTEEMKQEYEDLAYNLYKKYEKQGLYSDEYLDKIKSKCKETAKKQLMQKYRSRLTK